jgi:hypothetical protein
MSTVSLPAPSYHPPALRVVTHDEKPQVVFRRRRRTLRSARDRILSDPQYLLHLR